MICNYSGGSPTTENYAYTDTNTLASRLLRSTFGVGLAFVTASLGWPSRAVAHTRYTASWASVDQHKMLECYWKVRTQTLIAR